jgi:phosphatidylinositol-3-phosphatase
MKERSLLYGFFVFLLAVSARAGQYSGTPYSGSAVFLPGTVLGEDFDNGGEGVAYHDGGPDNLGGAYRSTGVDIENSTDGGYDVGWISAGEWLNYTVNVGSAGTYTITIGVASPNTGTSMHVGFNNASNVWQEISVPNTGGWQNWTTVSFTATLGAGVQQLTIFSDTGGYNFHRIVVSRASSPDTVGLSPYRGSPTGVPGIIQAEDFDNGGPNVAYYDTSDGNAGGAYRSTDVDIEPASGGGYDVGWIAPGEWLNYTIDVASAGTYVVQLRVASPGGGSMHVGFNAASHVWTVVNVPATGGWQSWTTVSFTATLGAGTQQMTLLSDTGGYNVDWVNVAPSSLTSGGLTQIHTVFVIVMENTNWSQILGNPNAVYINSQLIPAGAHANSYFTPPANHPSLPNYLWLEAGTNFGVTDDGPPTSHHQSTSAHLTTLLSNAGISWRSYQEDIPGDNCPLGDVQHYAVKHNPVVYFDDVTGTNDVNSAYCINHVRPYVELAGDLASSTVAHYNFITPNLCHDMHDCAISDGDAWLSTEVPRILESDAYRSGGALFIVWDEGTDDSDGPIGLIALSPFAKGNGYSNSIPYTHSSLLRTLETIFSVGPFLGDAVNATDLRDLFVSP